MSEYDRGDTMIRQCIQRSFRRERCLRLASAFMLVMTAVGALLVPATVLAAPLITSISPNSGSVAGGTTITITGTGFVNGSTVSLSGSSPLTVNTVSATTI